MTKDVSKALDLIYEAAFVPDSWSTVLDNMARAIGAEGTVLFNTRAASTRWLASPGIMSLINRIVEEDWTRRNTRAERLLAIPHHGFQNEAEYFTEEEYNQYPIYTELMRPSGYGFGAATAIMVPSGDSLVFSVEKKLVNGPVDRQGIDYLDVLRPHLARSAMMSSRLEFERITATVDALQLTGLPSAVLGFDGQVLATNSLLEEFSPQVKLAAFDRLLFAHRPANLFLADAIAQAGDHGGLSAVSSRSFPLPQLDDAPAAIVHLVPVRGNARDLFSRAAFFLIVTPVDRSRVPAAEVIQGLFDLTPAEARVARGLATGGNVATVAGQLSLSPETIRTHIKGILSKSGMARQTEFVAAIASIRPIA